MNLVLDRDTKPLVTLHRECAAVRAPSRALAEYLSTLRFPFNEGKHVKLEEVRDLKAAPPDLASYPSAAVYPEGEGQYGGSEDSPSFEPYLLRQDRAGSLFAVGEVRQTIMVDLWTNNDEIREACLAMLEDGLAPVEWMSGFLLEMPHYHGLRSQFQLISMSFPDNDSDNLRGYRKAMVRLQATCPFVRVFTLPELLPRATGTVE